MILDAGFSLADCLMSYWNINGSIFSCWIVTFHRGCKYFLWNSMKISLSSYYQKYFKRIIKKISCLGWVAGRQLDEQSKGWLWRLFISMSSILSTEERCKGMIVRSSYLCVLAGRSIKLRFVTEDQLCRWV